MPNMKKICLTTLALIVSVSCFSGCVSSSTQPAESSISTTASESQTTTLAETTAKPTETTANAAGTDTELGINFPRPSGNPVLKMGSTGDEVGWLQTALNKTGAAKLTVNSNFDQATDTAVRSFQSRCGLSVDGQAGPMTISKLVQILSGEQTMPPETQPPTTQATTKATTQATTKATTQAATKTTTQAVVSQAQNYVLNWNTMKFHYPSCSSVSDIKDENRQDVHESKDTIKSWGFSPCGRCNP